MHEGRQRAVLQARSIFSSAMCPACRTRPRKAAVSSIDMFCTTLLTAEGRPVSQGRSALLVRCLHLGGVIPRQNTLIGRSSRDFSSSSRILGLLRVKSGPGGRSRFLSLMMTGRSLRTPLVALLARRDDPPVNGEDQVPRDYAAVITCQATPGHRGHHSIDSPATGTAWHWRVAVLSQ